jgi:hypothetical protein
MRDISCRPTCSSVRFIPPLDCRGVKRPTLRGIVSVCGYRKWPSYGFHKSASMERATNATTGSRGSRIIALRSSCVFAFSSRDTIAGHNEILHKSLPRYPVKTCTWYRIRPFNMTSVRRLVSVARTLPDPVSIRSQNFLSTSMLSSPSSSPEVTPLGLLQTSTLPVMRSMRKRFLFFTKPCCKTRSRKNDTAKSPNFYSATNLFPSVSHTRSEPHKILTSLQSN